MKKSIRHLMISFYGWVETWALENRIKWVRAGGRR